MKAEDIIVGRYYRANVSGRQTTVRVESIGERNALGGHDGYSGRRKWVKKKCYNVVNLATGRECYFQTAAKFTRAIDYVRVAMYWPSTGSTAQATIIGGLAVQGKMVLVLDHDNLRAYSYTLRESRLWSNDSEGPVGSVQITVDKGATTSATLDDLGLHQ